MHLIDNFKNVLLDLTILFYHHKCPICGGQLNESKNDFPALKEFECSEHYYVNIKNHQWRYITIIPDPVYYFVIDRVNPKNIEVWINSEWYNSKPTFSYAIADLPINGIYLSQQELKKIIDKAKQILLLM